MLRKVEFLVKLKGTPCVRTADNEICGLCGNGTVDEDRGEECDDGNLDNEDQCLNSCLPSCLALGNCAAEDADMDGVVDNEDNCPMASNPSQTDCDGDGLGDACDEDACPAADGDGDGVADVEDNCPEVPNMDQTDCNQNGVGDVCDDTPCGPDGDGDGVPDSEDNCPEVANADQMDSDGDHAGDACDRDPTVFNVRVLQHGLFQASGVNQGERFQLSVRSLRCACGSGERLLCKGV